MEDATMGKCIIAAAGYGYPEMISYGPKDYLIAADGGLKQCLLRGIIPDVITGDFDSYGEVPDLQILGMDEKTKLMVHPVDKDDTDLYLAVLEGIRHGFCEFVIYGGQGGRPDHLYANIQTLYRLAKQNMTGYLYGDEYQMTVIRNAEMILSKDLFENRTEIQNVSVFSMNEKANGVTIQGAKFEVDHVALTNDVPLGVSNSYCNRDIRISVEEGSLLIMWQGKLSLDKIRVTAYDINK